MAFSFTDEDIEKIGNTLGLKPQTTDDSWTWQVKNKDNVMSLVFTVYNNVSSGNAEKCSMVSAQTQHGFFELHRCTGFIVFDPGELIFIQTEEKTVTSLIIGQEATCSMYANIDRKILSADFTNLNPALLPSAMQLSLIEEII